MSEREVGDPAHAVIAAEHRELSSLFAEARSAMEAEAGAQSTRSAFARLRDGMEAHFQREESLYYPTIWTLRPDLKESLTGLVETHPQFRERLGAIVQSLDQVAFAEAGRHLEEFAELFSDHERAEELLLQSLDVELSDKA